MNDIHNYIATATMPSRGQVSAQPPAPVKSDGNSSSYYKLLLGGQEIETQDIIYEVFGNDFDLGNIFKSLVRIQSSMKGVGKSGTSIEYDLNKIIYTCNKLKERL